MNNIIPFEFMMSNLTIPQTRDKIKLLEVYNFAVKWHDGQSRRNGEPYVNHPIRVAMLLRDFGDLYIMGALLHDVVEDTDVTFDMIEELTNSSVLLLVRGTTKRDRVNTMKALQVEMKRHPEAWIGALYIKLADRYDNLNDGINKMGSKTRKKYIKEHKKLIGLCDRYQVLFLVAELSIVIKTIK